MMRLFLLLAAFLGFIGGQDPRLVSDDINQDERFGGIFDSLDDAESELGGADPAELNFAVQARQWTLTDTAEQMKQPAAAWTARRHSDVL
jgi:hypothetical protein